MQFLNGITLLLIFQLIGEFGARLLDIPVPGPVVGMLLLLFLALLVRRSVPLSLDTASIIAEPPVVIVRAGRRWHDDHFERASPVNGCRLRSRCSAAR